MNRSSLLRAALGVALVCGGALFAADKKPGSDLPQFYDQLGLSAEQRSKISDLHSQYDPKIKDLSESVRSLDVQHRKAEYDLQQLEAKAAGAIEAVLTPDQARKLKGFLEPHGHFGHVRVQQRREPAKDKP